MRPLIASGGKLFGKRRSLSVSFNCLFKCLFRRKFLAREAIINRKTYNTKRPKKQGEIFVCRYSAIPQDTRKAFLKQKGRLLPLRQGRKRKANIKRKPSLPDQRAGRAVEKTKRIIKSNRKKGRACRLRSIKILPIKQISLCTGAAKS